MRVNVELITSHPGSPISPITARRRVAPPARRALIDSSLLTRFMGVGTFVSVASNWSAAPLAGRPGPWAGQLSSPCERQRMNYPHAATVPLIPDQPPRGNHRCAFNQARPLKRPRRAAGRVNVAVSQGSPLCRGRTRP